MFKVGDYMVYGKNGVYKVDNIGTVDMSGVSSEKIYYTLVPVNRNSSKVFTPVDNKRVIMRRLISKKDALALIEDIKNVETFQVESGRKMENIYKEKMDKCDCREWVSIIKTLNHKMKERIEQGKKATAGDEKYLRMAKENLLGEMSLSLNMPLEKVEEYIEQKAEAVSQA